MCDALRGEGVCLCVDAEILFLSSQIWRNQRTSHVLFMLPLRVLI